MDPNTNTATERPAQQTGPAETAGRPAETAGDRPQTLPADQLPPRAQTAEEAARHRPTSEVRSLEEPGQQFTRQSPASPGEERPGFIRRGSATFSAPPSASSRNGAIYRYAPAASGQGGALEVALVDGHLAITVTPDGGKPGGVRLPHHAVHDLMEALDRLDFGLLGS